MSIAIAPMLSIAWSPYSTFPTPVVFAKLFTYGFLKAQPTIHVGIRTKKVARPHLCVLALEVTRSREKKDIKKPEKELLPDFTSRV